MNQEVVLYRISQLLSRFSEQVEILNSNSEFSINTHAENILIKILNEIFNCNLKNVNYEENKNYPSIDLRDSEKRIAIQVTSNAKLEKVKHTLSEFVSNNLHKEFDQLYIYVITKKQKKYNQKTINRTTEGKFKFPSNHIIDRHDLYLMLNKQNDFQKISKVCQLLETQFSDNISENKKKLDKWEIYFKGLYEYDQYIANLYKYIDMRGFSPRVNNTLVRLDIDKIYVPLKFKYDFSNNFRRDAIIKDKSESFDITTALEKYSKIVVLGDPGSGKSTSLKYLAYEICANRAINSLLGSYVPIFIRAAEFANYYNDTGHTLSEYIIENTKYGSLFSNSLENNSLLVLFDGLDEINITNLRHGIVERLHSFIAQYPELRIIVSSRIVGYKETHLNSYFTHFEVDKFSDEQIQAFLINWFSSISSASDNNKQKALDEANELISSIRRNDSVYKLAGNPLLLTIIALIYYQGKKLPEKRASLYDIATSTFLDNWVKLRAIQRNKIIESETLIELLAPISFFIHENYPTGLLPEKELRRLLTDEYKKIYPHLPAKEEKQDINDIISFLREDAGFLFEKGLDENENPLFGFVHLTFQEYFAAIEFKTRWTEGSINSGNLNEYIFNPNWTEVIKLAACLFKLNEPSRLGRKYATDFITDIFNIDEILPEMNRRLPIICEILNEEVEVEFKVFQMIEDKLFDSVSYVTDEHSFANRSILRILSKCITLLLKNTYFQESFLDESRKCIESNPSSRLAKCLMEALVKNSKIPVVNAYLTSILKSNNLDIKACMFDIFTFPDKGNIILTKLYHSEFFKFVNSYEYTNKYNSKLYFIQLPYLLYFNTKDFFSSEVFSPSSSILYSMRLINDSKIKEQLANDFLFTFSRNEKEFEDFYKVIRKEFPNIVFSKIEKVIKYGLRECIFKNENGVEIYKKKDSNSTYAIIHNEDRALVDYPFTNECLKPFFGTQTNSIVVFLNMIIKIINRSSHEKVIINNDSELNAFIDNWDSLSMDVFDLVFILNKVINYMLSKLFVDGIANDNYINWLKKCDNIFYNREFHLSIDRSFKTDEFKNLIKTSSLNIFDKLWLLQFINPEFKDNELLSLAIEKYKKEDDPKKKFGYRDILYRIIWAQGGMSVDGPHAV